MKKHLILISLLFTTAFPALFGQTLQVGMRWEYLEDSLATASPHHFGGDRKQCGDPGSSQAAEKAVPPASQELPREVSGGLRLAVIPNPARESVQFHYAIPEVERGAQLRVFDPSGRMIRTWELKTNTGVIQWQVGGEAPKGIYLVSLVADGTIPVTTRFSIVE